jgi:hypothetical protein
MRAAEIDWPLTVCVCPITSFCSHSQQKFENLVRVSQIFNILVLTKCINVVHHLAVLFRRSTFGFYSVLCLKSVSRIRITDTSTFRLNKEDAFSHPESGGSTLPQIAENNQISYTVFKLQNKRHSTNNRRESEICVLLGIYGE